MQVLEDEIETTWVSKDGTSVEYRNIKPKDFWDPDGRSLFADDDDPDDEEENYTGNEGGQHWSLRHAVKSGSPGKACYCTCCEQEEHLEWKDGYSVLSSGSI